MLSVGVDLGGVRRRALGMGLLLRRHGLSLVGGRSLRLSRLRLLLRSRHLRPALGIGVDLGRVSRRSLGVGLLLRRHGLSLVGGRSLRLGGVRRLGLLL